MKTFLLSLCVLLTGLVLTNPAKALHQGGNPSINCVAVVYSDFSFENVPWADVGTISPGFIVEMRVIHDTGASAGPGSTIFTGFQFYGIKLRGDDLLSVHASPSPAASGITRIRLFRAIGTQSRTLTLPDGIKPSMDLDAMFVSIPITGMDFLEAQEIAAAVDVGLCSP
ncbi:MAG: hypothetical protein V3W19_08875 [Desulfatiglandales bacterium]